MNAFKLSESDSDLCNDERYFHEIKYNKVFKLLKVTVILLQNHPQRNMKYEKQISICFSYFTVIYNIKIITTTTQMK